MKPCGSFKINHTFSLQQRGVVLTGTLLEGTVDSGNYLKIPRQPEELLLKIVSVEYVDHLQPHHTELGLVVKPKGGFFVTEIEAYRGVSLLVMNAGNS
ncbi:hypothetical protein [Mucilaginibacter sp. CSA2-8R]|uniref:hypothetical protein n=1 Tax=Mucilaginibacter sp. CSA2-8R TaxID=3141542 RepID=UPI00315CE13A